jgi:hypothetical protein
MNKYFVLFCVPVATMEQWAKTVSPEERKKQSDQMMQDWQKWMDKVGGSLIDKGMPLGKTKRVTKGNVADVRNDLNYYVILQAQSHDAAAAIVADNPHLEIPDAYIEVVEISHTGI